MNTFVTWLQHYFHIWYKFDAYLVTYHNKRDLNIIKNINIIKILVN